MICLCLYKEKVSEPKKHHSVGWWGHGCGMLNVVLSTEVYDQAFHYKIQFEDVFYTGIMLMDCTDRYV